MTHTTETEAPRAGASAVPADEVMTAAELRVITEYLGIDQTSMARMLDVADRSVRRWIAGTAPIPDGVRVWVERIEAATADAVGQVLAAIMDEPDPVLIVYRTDEEMWGERPDSEPMPARWWRMVAARAAHEAPGLTITY